MKMCKKKNLKYTKVLVTKKLKNGPSICCGRLSLFVDVDNIILLYLLYSSDAS